MGVKINTTISEVDIEDKESILFNEVLKTIEGGDFEADFFETKRIPLDSVSAASLSINVFDKISIEKGKLTFLHVFCQTVVQNPDTVIEAINFAVTFEEDQISTFLTKTSQFQLIDIKDLVPDIIINGIELTAPVEGGALGQKAELIIIAGGIS